MRGPIGCGAGVLVLSACVALWLGGVLVTHWFGERAKAEAMALQLEGQCSEAIPRFERIARQYSHLARWAEDQLVLCEHLVTADQARDTARWTDAVRAYRLTADLSVGQPFEIVPLGRLANLQAIARADATTLEACRGIAILDAFRAEGVPLAPEAEETIPTAIFQCGRASDNANNYRMAADMYARLLAEYPGHSSAAEARRLRIDAEINDAFGKPAGELPPPRASGPGRAGVVTLEIVNDSPAALELFFSGPTSDSIVLDPCPTCPRYPSVGPPSCPNRGPRQTITLPPGTYRVHARSRSQTSVTPYTGTWNLTVGTRYAECYFIVQR
ncbi:MAG: hypothetical protein KatS3mg060_0132 [Dehalococcoidia bacterium]|nr:MAG: hypothetical protein KatS3mg060_0132 [Dehalococcoidia bacterium]